MAIKFRVQFRLLLSLFVVPLFFLACSAGISLSRSGGDGDVETETGGLPGSPTATTLSASTSLCGPGIVTSNSGNYTGVLCIDPVSFQGVDRGTSFAGSNPLMEVGIERVKERTAARLTAHARRRQVD